MGRIEGVQPLAGGSEGWPQLDALALPPGEVMVDAPPDRFARATALQPWVRGAPHRAQLAPPSTPHIRPFSLTIPVARTTTRAFSIGDRVVTARIYQGRETPVVYFNMHDDENTSVDAGRLHVDERGGTLIDLQHSGDLLREIHFKLDGQSYAFDPNRIFTDGGARRTLLSYGRTSPRAEAAVRAFAQSILRELGIERAQFVIALHNNTDGRYSILSYAAGGDMARDAAAVHVNTSRDPDDFFFAVQRPHYEALRAGAENVALQDNAGVTDDGSLSVYAGRHGWNYVNVEAQKLHLKEQHRMLGVLDDLLRPGG